MAVGDIDAAPASDVRSKWVGIYVGVLATLLAICTLGGGNATKDAIRANIDVTNTWSFFQAKNVRRAALQIAADDLELQLQANPQMPAEVRAVFGEKIKAYRSTAERFTSDPKTGEGLDELFQKAKEIEKEREISLRRDPYFDMAQALLQIGIVLASVALIAGTNTLIWVSAGLGTLGTLLMVNGFLLLVKIPGLG